MRKKIYLTILLTLILSTLTINHAMAQSTYIYAWIVPNQYIYNFIPITQKIEENKVYVLIWQSPWMIHKYEHRRLIKSFGTKFFIHKGYKVIAVDRSDIESGKFKLGLIQVINQ